MATDDKDKKEEMMPNSNFGSMSLYNSDLWKRAKERIDAMPEGKEKERAKFLLAQDYAGLKDILGADVASSEAMFNEQMPEGRQAGQVYVAANPLEFVASALRQGIGAKGRRNSMDALRQLSADQAEARGNIQFPGDGGGQERPIPQQQTQAQKPDLGQYGIQLGQNPQGAGMGQVTPRGGQQSPQQIQNAVDRRGKAEALGIETPEIGQGRVGQAKLATGLRGMGKPDLARYGAQTANAGMGQLTDRLPQLQDMPSHEQQPLFGQPRPAELKNALGMIDPTPEGVQWQTPEELRREKERISRQRMLGGY